MSTRSGKQRQTRNRKKNQTAQKDDDDAKSSVTENLNEEVMADGEDKENFLLDTSMKMQGKQQKQRMK